MIGLETALPILWQTMIDSKLMSQTELMVRMSTKPAEIGRYHDQGKAIAIGQSANLTLFNPSKGWKVDRDLVRSKSRNTPFHGMEFSGSISATFFNGKRTF